MACNCHDPVHLTTNRDSIRRQSDGSIRVTINGRSYDLSEFDVSPEALDFCQSAIENSECLISNDSGNNLRLGEDGLLYAEQTPIPPIPDPCESAIALSNCIISDDPFNLITQGSDGLIYSQQPSDPNIGIMVAGHNSVSTQYDLTTVGTVTTDIACVSFNNPTDDFLSGLIHLDNNFLQIILNGGGIVFATLEYSVDGGANWLDGKHMILINIDSAENMKYRSYSINDIIHHVTIPPIATVNICVRCRIEVTSGFATGSSATLDSRIRGIFGTPLIGIL